MLYVSGKFQDEVSITDTDDNVTEEWTVSSLRDLYFECPQISILGINATISPAGVCN